MSRLDVALWLVFRRELTLAWRRRADIAVPWVFYIIVVSLFPLAVGPEPETLRTIGPGVIWVAALLATMLSLGHLFDTDYADGSLEQLALAPHPLSLLVLAKVAAHWVLAGLPLVLIAPLLAIQLQMDTASLETLLYSLLLGTPVLILLGSVGAALTLGLRGGGVLVSLLVLPLYTPVLIFGASAVMTATQGHGAEMQLSLLGAFLALSLTFTPWASAAALRISLD